MLPHRHIVHIGHRATVASGLTSNVCNVGNHCRALFSVICCLVLRGEEGGAVVCEVSGGKSGACERICGDVARGEARMHPHPLTLEASGRSQCGPIHNGMYRNVWDTAYNTVKNCIIRYEYVCRNKFDISMRINVCMICMICMMCMMCITSEVCMVCAMPHSIPTWRAVVQASVHASKHQSTKLGVGVERNLSMSCCARRVR